MENTKNNQELTQKELFRYSLRWMLTAQICWNYERMMAAGYLNTMLPYMKKKYKDKPNELKEMLEMENQFFNVTPHMGHFLVGIDLAMQEKEGTKAKEVVSGLKTGLMGPFSGVGDTIFGVLIPTIIGSIAAYMGVKGDITGVIIALLVNIAIAVARIFFLPIGYKQGTRLVNDFSDKLTALTESATLLGITVIGALVPTVIKANVSLVYKSGEVEMKLQEILDQIVPSIIPVALVGLVYWLLGKKGMTSTKAILLVMVLSIVLYNLKFLG
ncbi:PTS system, mannose-specific IID component [Pilibacter termitis]|uniref:PTS system, mannose-specific IID component n=2 Tax=Pilibacter termitis TaxID=263852 RepID=A0A1T4LKW8_9ENTE|nr:PTS system, mannose-specific IID component [Pilibacter termitis]